MPSTILLIVGDLQADQPQYGDEQDGAGQLRDDERLVELRGRPVVDEPPWLPPVAPAGRGRTGRASGPPGCREPVHLHVFAARTIGATLLTIAILNWSASTSTVTPAGVVLANVFMNAALGIVDASNIIGGTIGASSWSGVVIHAALVLAFGVCQFRAMRRHNAARPA